MSTLKEIKERHERVVKLEDNSNWAVDQMPSAHKDRGELLKIIEELEARVEELKESLRISIAGQGVEKAYSDKLEAQLAANKETIRLLIDRWNGEAGEWLGSDDCAYELQQALEKDDDNI